MKTHRHLVLALLAWAAAFPARAVDPTPYAWEFPEVSNITGATELLTELQEYVQEVLDAGNLGPLYVSRADQASFGWASYQEPGRVITTLAWAYPHLTPTQQGAVRTYVAAALGDARFAPWGAYPMPKNAGARRERHPRTKWWYEDATFGARRPSVHTLYGLWLYGHRTGDWPLVQTHWASIKTAYAARSGQGNLYGTMGAHVAMVRLAEKFADTATRATALSNLTSALNAGTTFATVESAAQTTYFPDMYDARTAGSIHHGWMFLNLTPELGRYLKDNVSSAVLTRHATGVARFPFWWISQANYFNRNLTGDEGTGLVPEFFGMFAPVERWVVGASAATLEAQMKSAPTGIGDCYWLEALVQAIEAKGTLSWTDVRTGKQVPFVSASANPTSGLPPLAVQFTGTASDPDGGAITAWAWSFGDGATSASQSPAHTFTAPGTYAVVLTVTDDDGQTASASVVITVTGPSQDAGSLADAGPEVDGGIGSSPDAGVEADGGTGSGADAGEEPDAGGTGQAPGEPDAGTVERQGIRGTCGGCASTAAAPAGWLLLWAALGQRRRRRRTTV